MARFEIRRRSAGWVVWDAEGGVDASGPYSRITVAEHACTRLNNNTSSLRTYGVTWYCEVDATSPEEATKKARRYLAPSYRENWNPLSVDDLTNDDDKEGTDA